MCSRHRYFPVAAMRSPTGASAALLMAARQAVRCARPGGAAVHTAALFARRHRNARRHEQRALGSRVPAPQRFGATGGWGAAVRPKRRPARRSISFNRPGCRPERRREFLLNPDPKAPATRRLPLDRRPSSRDQPLSRGAQLRSKAIPLDQARNRRRQ